MIPQNYFLDWLLFLGLVGLIMMGADKIAARTRRNRIRERTLWLASLLGGFGGIILGGILFQHKTAKPSFWLPVGLAAAIWLGAYFLLFASR